ncbi:hypothetical protein K502DRAFT_331027 [Neoconidiobolus thromboides FSU 785]|nr:hypothetical protein K502DRAFT_331027 [Neoconidiobolus thromboides FSU 785]
MSTRLFFGHLATGTHERDIEKLLKGYGEIVEISLLERFGFVEFRSSSDAKEVQREFDGKTFRGERLVVEYAKSRHPRDRQRNNNNDRSNNNDRNNDRRRGPPTRTDNRLLIRNLSSRANWQDLKDLMRRAGEVCFADAHKEHQGEGIVEFEKYDDMKYALDKFQNYEFRGRRLEIIDDSRSHSRRSSRRNYSKSRSRSPRRHRERSPRRSPRRSYRRSRSPSRSRSPRRSRRSPSPRRGRDSRRSDSPRRGRSYSGSNRSRSPYQRRDSNADRRSPTPDRKDNEFSPRPHEREASPDKNDTRDYYLNTHEQEATGHADGSPGYERAQSPEVQNDVYADEE